MGSAAPHGSPGASPSDVVGDSARPSAAAPAQIETLRAELGALRATVRQNDDEIDALQLQAAIGNRPWYRSIETLVAVFALLLSLTTTVVSGYWARSQNEIAEQRLRQQEIQESRRELRGLLQALSDLDRERNEILAQQDDPMIASYFDSSYAAETSLLANQAYDVITGIPDHVSSSEYAQLGLRLMTISDFPRAEPMFDRAVATATNVYDYIGAARSYGQLLYQLDKPDAGRQRFEQALAVWDIFPSESAVLMAFISFGTELAWASTLLTTGYCDEVPEHMDKARGHLNALPAVIRGGYQRQYTAQALQVVNCVPNEVAGAA
jgi:hypothetical protein